MATARQASSHKTPISLMTSGGAAIPEKVSPAGSTSDLTPVRRSTRDIKRKKFDDELMDSAIASKSARKQRNSVSEAKPANVAAVLDDKLEQESTPSTTPVPSTQLPLKASSPTIDAATTKAEAANTTDPALSPDPLLSQTTATPAQQPAPKAKKSRPSKKSAAAVGPSNAQLLEQAAALKDVGRWQPTDDLALITAIMQTSDLKAIYTGVKFTCKFTLQEIAERWYALLYDPMISKLAQEAMKQLPPDIALSVQSITLFNKNEERMLSSIPSTVNPSIDLFNELLLKHPDVFHPARTTRSLYQHWLHMREYRVLMDQKPLPLPQGEYVMNFSDLEDNFSESDVPSVDPATERELTLTERHLTKQIRQLENELPKWHVLVEHATGITTPDFDQNTVAVLRGRLVRYLMRSKEVTMGRNARGYEVDINLALEGPAFKVSRKQATIKLRNTGEFFMVNEGKRPMYIDGKPLMPGSKSKLNNNAVIEVACLRLLFLVNQEMINNMPREQTKTTLA